MFLVNIDGENVVVTQCDNGPFGLPVANFRVGYKEARTLANLIRDAAIQAKKQASARTSEGKPT
jgi:hypothetical protein